VKKKQKLNRIISVFSKLLSGRLKRIKFWGAITKLMLAKFRILYTNLLAGSFIKLDLAGRRFNQKGEIIGIRGIVNQV